MKRTALFLACILLLGIAGWVAYRLQKPPAIAAVVSNAARASSNATPNLAPIGDPVPRDPNTQEPSKRTDEIVGIGAILRAQSETGAVIIAGVVPNSPAAAAGLAGNFLIRKVDNQSTEGMKLKQCVDLLRGVAGTKVRLELFDIDANETRSVELTRQKIQLALDEKIRRNRPVEP